MDCDNDVFEDDECNEFGVEDVDTLMINNERRGIHTEKWVLFLLVLNVLIALTTLSVLSYTLYTVHQYFPTIVNEI